MIPEQVPKAGSSDHRHIKIKALPAIHKQAKVKKSNLVHPVNRLPTDLTRLLNDIFAQ